MEYQENLALVRQVWWCEGGNLVTIWSRSRGGGSLSIGKQKIKVKKPRPKKSAIKGKLGGGGWKIIDQQGKKTKTTSRRFKNTTLAHGFSRLTREKGGFGALGLMCKGFRAGKKRWGHLVRTERVGRKESQKSKRDRGTLGKS